MEALGGPFSSCLRLEVTQKEPKAHDPKENTGKTCYAYRSCESLPKFWVNAPQSLILTHEASGCADPPTDVPPSYPTPVALAFFYYYF